MTFHWDNQFLQLARSRAAILDTEIPSQTTEPEGTTDRHWAGTAVSTVSFQHQHGPSRASGAYTSPPREQAEIIGCARRKQAIDLQTRYSAQQAALRGNNNSTVAKSQKMLRRRQRQPRRRCRRSERNNSETVQFAHLVVRSEALPERDPFLSEQLMRETGSPSSNGMPKQEPAPEATTTARSPRNGRSVGGSSEARTRSSSMLSVARSAKQQVMKAAKRLT